MNQRSGSHPSIGDYLSFFQHLLMILLVNLEHQFTQT